jgi:hypothetical protein
MTNYDSSINKLLLEIRRVTLLLVTLLSCHLSDLSGYVTEINFSIYLCRELHLYYCCFPNLSKNILALARSAVAKDLNLLRGL